ncbi:SAM-dependent chlorinase/fluorinase [uncultured Flavobacterium sp.]|uniref:SAM hydrolase/SAM-dependent halogenase family protein n=1 Tax=uncultured Flavobacterium sp. TaxID=165435 RepID=UPI0030EB5FEF|tara:strand:- start:19417 stop:20241 length:825 start_codon:yes stop_codon:yes gene_type:complete
MSIITLTSDFGSKDHYVGALKGKILSQFLEAKIVDLTHQIDLFNVFETSYILEASYKNFPKNTVHIICVNAERIEGIEHIVMLWEDQFFIAADNGILNSLIQKKKAQKIAIINIHDRLEDISNMSVFATVACHLAKGGNMSVIGKEIDVLNEFYTQNLIVSDTLEEIKGNVIYIDHFGNCVTNITKKVFEETAKNRNFEIKFKNKTVEVIHKKYSDFKITATKKLKDFEGEYLALFNEAGYLEIAIYNGNPDTVGSATSLLGLKFRDNVSIKFK